MRSFEWGHMLNRGAAGVAALSAYYRGEGLEVVDVTRDPRYQSCDIDLLVEDAWVEVKTDSHRPDNLFLELTSDGKPGCLFKSRATLWAVLYPAHGLFYEVPLPQLQWWAVYHALEYRPISVKSTRGKRAWTATGIAVPVSVLRRQGVDLRVRTIERD